jgi:RNA polymerase sigma-70 factor (ECF subfamily)
MKANAAAITTTMRFTPDNNVLAEKENVSEMPLEKTRELFLDYLLPVKKPLYNFIRKTLNFSPDADDIFQDTLLKGFRYFYSFDRRKNFKSWIFAIAHNLIKDAFTAAPGHTVISLEEAGEAAAEEAPVGGLARDVREIYALARQLPLRPREVFFLYYYNEFKVSEIVEIMGLSRANVKFILHQARKTIKKILEVAP